MKRVGPIPTPPVERVERRCIREDRGYETPCLVYMGPLNKNGYGSINIGSRYEGNVRSRVVHRITYEHHVGPVPEGLDLDHLCRVRNCCEPTHLDPVTRRENVRRGVNGMVVAARQRAKTHCPQGHPYDDANTYWRLDGSRACRACRRSYDRLRYPQRRAELMLRRSQNAA